MTLRNNVKNWLELMFVGILINQAPTGRHNDIEKDHLITVLREVLLGLDGVVRRIEALDVGIAARVFAKAARARGSSSTMSTRISILLDRGPDLTILHAGRQRIQNRNGQADRGGVVFGDAEPHTSLV